MVITQKNLNIENLSENFICDICNSMDIIETQQGYVCKSCGIVLNIQKLTYHTPRNEEAIQYSPRNVNQIGFRKERLKSKYSRTLKHMNKLNNLKSRSDSIKTEVKIEVKRIFESLDLPRTYFKEIIDLVLEIRSKLGKGTKYRAVRLLVPVVIYIALKMKLVPINQYELLEVAKINKKDFNAFKLQIYNIKPDYVERNRKEYIIRRIFEIRENFQLDMQFYHVAQNILDRMWDVIKNTTDDVIAGLVGSITVLCKYKDKITISQLCDLLGIQMSTIQSQVKRRIFDRLKIAGFQSLVKSSGLLKKVMEKYGILGKISKIEASEIPAKRKEFKVNNSQKIDAESDEKEIKRQKVEIPEIFEIELKTFNNKNETVSVFIIKTEDKKLLIVYPELKNEKPLMRRQKSILGSSDITIEIICLKGSKGPPPW